MTKKKEAKVITIDRSKWVCGGGRHREVLGGSALLNGMGRMCCLGQICKIEGVPEDKLYSHGYPTFVEDKRVPVWMIEDGYNSRTARDMANINDDRDLTQKKRESILTGLAKSVGIILKFKGRLLPVK